MWLGLLCAFVAGILAGILTVSLLWCCPKHQSVDRIIHDMEKKGCERIHVTIDGFSENLNGFYSERIKFNE